LAVKHIGLLFSGRGKRGNKIHLMFLGGTSETKRHQALMILNLSFDRQGECRVSTGQKMTDLLL
jgi:hypothetical protein